MSHRPPDPPVDPFGSIADWAPFIGNEEASQLLAGLGALGGSQELMDQIAAAVIPGAQAPALSGMTHPPQQLSPEEQLRRTERRFRLLVENLPCVAFIAGMGQVGSEVYLNPYIEQLLGYTRDEWMRDPFLWYWRLHPDDRAAWNQEFARGLMTGGPWQADCRFLAADGRSVWVRGHARIVRDEQGRPLYLQGLAFDITPLREELARAQAERVRLRNTLAALPAAVIAVAEDDSLIHVSPAARERLELRPAPAMTFPELAQGLADPAPVLELVERCRATREPVAATLGRLTLDCRPLPAPPGGKCGFVLTVEAALPPKPRGRKP